MTNILKFVFYIYAFATLVQLGYWLGVFRQLAFYKDKTTPDVPTDGDEEPPVSIVICAKNEGERLEKNLYHIVNQSYRCFEILLINDDSTDTTESIGLSFQSKYATFRMISVRDKPAGQVGKKYALALGIKAARYDRLLLTDADCRPNSDQWLRKMSHLLQNKDIAIGLGYGPYRAEAGFLNQFIRFETVQTAMQYFSFALMGNAYMGVGRNLIYKKKLFEKNKGFDSHQHIASGDDDLLVRDIATKRNVAVTIAPETFVYSVAEQSWAAYYRQKCRHLSTGKHYAWRHKIALGGYSLSHFLHYLGFAVLCFANRSTMFALCFYALRMMIVWYLYGRILKKLQEPQLYWKIPILDALYVVFYALFAPALFFSRTNKWK